MKKLWFALIAVLLIATLLAPNVATAEETGGSRAQNSEIYTFVEELCERQKSDKASVRNFLKEKFDEALCGVGTTHEQKFQIGEKEYFNLWAQIKKSDTDNQIIIGAHYDSIYEGAGDNACGIAALYLTMKALASNVSAPYNIVFVAFDGEEDGLLGSRYYVDNMSSIDIYNTVVMFNFDTIATGDKLYLMCENKPTDLAKLILSNAEGIQEKPYAKGTFGTFDLFGYGYTELVQGSDHTPFRLAGIPIAFFFSGTYSAMVWNYAESTFGGNEVMNTSSDTFENLVEKHPAFEDRINSVSDAVVKTITSERFSSDVAGRARKQLVNLNFWYNVAWPIITVVVIGIAAIVLAILYYRKLQKNAILGESEIKSNTVFDKPKAEDIFSFKSDDSDDIFTFKR